MILSHVWGYSFDPGTNVVDVLVSRLRDKVDEGFDTEADSHRARRRLCPQAGLIASARRSACGWRRGTSARSWPARCVIGGLTYGLLASLARNPRSRHHPVDAARVRDALPGRRPARAGPRHRDRAAIGIARAAVRAAGRALRGRAALFAAGNAGAPSTCRSCRAAPTTSGAQVRARDRNAVLEVATHRRRRRHRCCRSARPAKRATSCCRTSGAC